MLHSSPKLNRWLSDRQSASPGQEQRQVEVNGERKLQKELPEEYTVQLSHIEGVHRTCR